MHNKKLFKGYLCSNYNTRDEHSLTEIENKSGSLGGSVHNHYCICVQEEPVAMNHACFAHHSALAVM